MKIFTVIIPRKKATMTFKEILKDKEIADILKDLWISKIDSQSFNSEANILTGNNWDYTMWSRHMNIFMSTLEYSKDDVDFKIEYKKIQQERNIINKRITQLARWSRLEDGIAKIETNKYNVPVNNRELDDTPWYILSDIHYNHDEQITKAFNRFEDNTINLILNGDFVNGAMRVGDLVNGDYQLIEDTYALFDKIMDTISATGIVVKQVIIVKGNHDEIRFTDYKGLANPNIATILGREFSKYYDTKVVDNYETKYFYVSHGHQYRGKASFMKSKFDKLNIIGHFHEFNYQDNNLILPAIGETDTYAKSLGLDSKSGFLIINKGHIKKINI